jgi:hypothetical protein
MVDPNHFEGLRMPSLVVSLDDNHHEQIIYMILSLSVLVILAYSLVLKFQGWFDIHLRHLLQACIPVTKTCVLTCNNGQTWVTVSFGVGRTRNIFAQPPNHPTIASKMVQKTKSASLVKASGRKSECE